MDDPNYKYRRDKLAFVTDKPDIGYLLDEYERSIYNGGNIDRFNENDSIRLSRWEGQSSDGKKWSHQMKNGQQAFPFEGASDVRTRMVDSIIRELTSIAMTSFQRAQVRVSGVDMTDTEKAGAAQLVMKWVVENKLRADLEKEMELWLQYTLTYGWSVMHVGWEQRLAKRPITITMNELNELGSANPQIQIIRDAIVNNEINDMAFDMIQSAFGMTKKEAGKFIRDIGKNGQGEILESYVAKNLPVIAALKPYDEVGVPPETLDLQDARVIFRRTFMNEVEFRSAAQAEGWDKEFVEEACETQGKSTFYDRTNLVPVSEHQEGTVNDSDNLIEVVYAYSKQISEDGTPTTFYTIFCPNVREDLFGKHEMLDYSHGQYPFIDLRQEMTRRAMTESRGIPEVSFTDQEEIKAQHDSLRDRTAFETFPAILARKRGGTINKIGPGVLVPVLNKDDYSFMPPPSGSPQLAFNLIERVEAKAAAYYGLYHPAVPPIKTQTQQQFFVNKFLGSVSAVYKQMFSLCLQYMPPELIQRITGIPLDVSAQDAHDLYDFNVRFDVRELDTEWNLEKLKAISQFALPMDSVGIIDRGKLVQRIMETISPDAARDLLVDQKTASQKTYDDMQVETAKMLMGIEPRYPENDPQAQQKMQALNDIVSKSMKAQGILSSDQQAQAIYQNYIKSLEMSVMQEQNKIIGRTGVSPVSDKMMQEQQQAPQPQ